MSGGVGVVCLFLFFLVFFFVGFCLFLCVCACSVLFLKQFMNYTKYSVPTQGVSVYLAINFFNYWMDSTLLCIWKKMKYERNYEELKQESNFLKGEKKKVFQLF